VKGFEEVKRVGRMNGAILAALPLFWVLPGCSPSVEAPTNAGVCWRLTGDGTAAPGFSPVTTGAPNLETCAANLEAVAMREHRDTLTGAYRGQFVFITPYMVQSSLHLRGARYRLFDAAVRATIDRHLRWMLQDEKHPSKFAPPTPAK
jgi:hypothetical protein